MDTATECTDHSLKVVDDPHVYGFWPPTATRRTFATLCHRMDYGATCRPLLLLSISILNATSAAPPSTSGHRSLELYCHHCGSCTTISVFRPDFKICDVLEFMIFWFMQSSNMFSFSSSTKVLRHTSIISTLT